MPRSAIRAFAYLVVLPVVLPAAARASWYRIVDLGTIAGENTYGMDVSSDGRVAGYSVSKAALWRSDGTRVDIPGLPGGLRSSACAINDAGVVCGQTVRDATGLPNAWVWSEQGAVEPIGELPGKKYSTAYDISNSGVAVGACSNGSAVFGGASFRWSASTGLQPLAPAAGDAGSVARGLNELGQVVGGSRNNESPSGHWRACLWDSQGNVSALGGINDPDSMALSINEAGAVLVYAYSSSTDFHSLIWSLGGIVELGLCRGWCINDQGLVTGDRPSSTGVNEAFVWSQSDGMTSLPGLAEGMPSFANALNSDAVAVGYAKGSDGLYHAVKWEPVPEPCSLLSLASAVLGVITLRRKTTTQRI